LNLLDCLIIACLAYGSLRGLRRGLARSLIGLAGLALGLILASTFARPLSEHLEARYSTVSRVAASIAAHLPLSSTVAMSPAGEGGALADAVESLSLPDFLTSYFAAGVERLGDLPSAATVGEALSTLVASSLVIMLCFVGIFFATQLAARVVAAVVSGAISVTPLVFVDRLAGLVLGAVYSAVVLTLLLGGLSLLATMPAFAFVGSAFEGSTLAPVFVSVFQGLVPRAPLVFPPG
jgi:uncharacterized membrane protein required for colicin V production